MSERAWLTLGGLNTGLLIYNVVLGLNGTHGIVWFGVVINILAVLSCWFGWRIAVAVTARRQQFDREIEELMRRGR